MQQPQLEHSYLVRVLRTVQGQRLSVQDIRTREIFEFASWQELSRFMQVRENKERLGRQV